MPSFKIASSLFEPVTVEVEGGRTFTSRPLSPQLIQGIRAIEERVLKSGLDAMEAVTLQVGLIFGVDPKEIEAIDVRILQRILEYSTEAMKGGRGGSVPADQATPAPVAPEVTAEKNVPKPEADPLL